jgi:phosphoribosylformimino-5-aminoimidazole carboxamide ribonucleotide (ProFAR) isomerase
VTSFLFPNNSFSLERLQSLLASLGGDKEKLVIDISCRRRENTWYVATNKWQTITEMEVNQGNSSSSRDISQFSANQVTLMQRQSLFLNLTARSS